MQTPDWSQVPEAFGGTLKKYWQAWQEQQTGLPASLVKDLPRVWACSDFVAQQMVRDSHLAAWLASADGVFQTLDASVLQQQVQAAVQAATDEASLMQVLRQIRQRQMCRIIWRDLVGLGDYHATVADLSLLAETLIAAAYDRVERWWVDKLGQPLDRQGQPVRMVVFAMGKLGAYELNLSSDIDLIFAYEHEGRVEKYGKETAFAQFFMRLGQQLIRVLDQVTPDGFVFRVDMRLRPWGSSGALALSFDAMESYYAQQGREWERYALIKMRPLAGDVPAGQRMVQRLVPFVYRRYIDYGAFEHLRDMKALIEREVRLGGMQDDIKLGAGGIREIEFIVQAFQLIRGGQIVELRNPTLLAVLPLLVEHHLLPQDIVDELAASYVFLRNTEHRLQAVADQQTQRLPADDTEKQRLAFAMECVPAEFAQRLYQHRRQVSRHFANVIAPAGTDNAAATINQDLLSIWQAGEVNAAAIAELNMLGMEEAEQVLTQWMAFRHSRVVAQLQPVAAERLGKLVPLLLEVLAYQGTNAAVSERLILFLDAILRRSTYMALLVENPVALTQLVKLSAASPFIAEQLTEYPVLLEELLNVRTLYTPPSRKQLTDELHQHLLRLPDKDLEQQMEALRNFKQAHLLRVAASEVTDEMPLMKVSDYLTWLAEAILEQVVQLAWEQMVARHGTPVRVDGAPCAPDFIIVGYGKLGGIELGHSSDLDLVFLHDGAPDGMTNGDKPLANEAFFVRLGQRIIHILATRTLSGPLYEVDMRLRPGGSSGLLVSSLAAFGKYQQDQAWLWEHQALVRARPVAGDELLGRRFEQLRRALLCQPRDDSKLKAEVLDMRERMRQHQKAVGEGLFDLKQGQGGIVDIEFMVQYGVLRWAHRHPELTVYTDNVRLLETLAAQKLMSAQDAGLLREAYLAYRSATHTQALKNEPAQLPVERFGELARGVVSVWQRWFA